MVKAKLQELTSQWRGQVVAFIKEKDKVLNPEKYSDEQPQKRLKLNSNFFDDESENDSCGDSDQSDHSPVMNRRLPFPIQTQATDYSSSIDPDASLDNPIPPKSNAEIRSSMLNDELVRYAQYSKEEFNQKLEDFGFSSDKSGFQPVGKFVWQYWQEIKHEFPIIYGAIKNILTAPTSSSAVERLFSKISAFVSRNSNAYKAKNLIILIQISEIEQFQAVSAEICRQNGVHLDISAETVTTANIDTSEFESSIDENFDIFEEQMF